MREAYVITWRSGDWMLLDIDNKHTIASGKDAIADKPIGRANDLGYEVAEFYSCLPSFEWARYRDYLEHEYGRSEIDGGGAVNVPQGKAGTDV